MIKCCSGKPTPVIRGKTDGRRSRFCWLFALERLAFMRAVYFSNTSNVYTARNVVFAASGNQSTSFNFRLAQHLPAIAFSKIIYIDPITWQYRPHLLHFQTNEMPFYIHLNENSIHVVPLNFAFSLRSVLLLGYLLMLSLIYKLLCSLHCNIFNARSNNANHDAIC